MINNVNIFTTFTLKRHEKFRDNLSKQNKSSTENEEVPGLIIRKGKFS